MAIIVPFKINPFETHDRFIDFTKKKEHAKSIGECCQDIIDKAPFGNRPFYIFVHSRTEDTDAAVKRVIWHPRLTRPKAQTNSMLFKVHPGTDVVLVIWMIPERSLWKQYQKGNVTENKVVCDSIYNFLHKRDELERPDEDDLSDEMVNNIYTELAVQAKYDKLMEQRYNQPMPKIEVASSIF